MLKKNLNLRVTNQQNVRRKKVMSVSRKKKVMSVSKAFNTTAPYGKTPNGEPLNREILAPGTKSCIQATDEQNGKMLKADSG